MPLTGQPAEASQDNLLIVFLATAPAGNPVHVRIELLVRHFWPGEEKSTCRAVLQAILGGALMQVEFRLDDSGQASNAKVRGGKPTPRQAAFRRIRDVRPDHLGHHPCDFGVVIHIVLAIVLVLKSSHLLRPWSLLLLVPWGSLLHWLQSGCG